MTFTSPTTPRFKLIPVLLLLCILLTGQFRSGHCACVTFVKYADMNCTGEVEEELAPFDISGTPSEECAAGPFPNEPDFTGSLDGQYCSTSGTVIQMSYADSANCTGEGEMIEFSATECTKGYLLKEECVVDETCESGDGAPSLQFLSGNAWMVSSLLLLARPFLFGH